MPRQTREERAARSSATGRRWAAWLKPAMNQAHIGPTELAERTAALLEPDRSFDKSNVSHWLAGKYGAEPDRAIAIAQVLGRDAVEALHAAGHRGIAQFAEDLRANATEAIIKRELDAIELDDPFLDQLAAYHKREIVTDEEYARLREEHLRAKREIILGMREAHRAEQQRETQPEPPAGSNGQASAM